MNDGESNTDVGSGVLRTGKLLLGRVVLLVLAEFAREEDEAGTVLL